MKKLWVLISLIAMFGWVLAGCGSQDTNAGAKSAPSADKPEKQVIKVGLNGSGVPIWDKMKEKAAKEGIDLQLVEFADYVRPNLALADGDIDLNAFQTISYFNAFTKEHNLKLTPIATTIIAPMGIYSQKYKKVTDIPDGSTIAVPEDVTNLGRALLLLEKAKLITLPTGFDGNGTVDQIKENPKHLVIKPIVAAQTPRVLPDVAASVINNGVAVEAGFTPVKDAIYIEDDTAQAYINIIASRADEKDKEVFKKIVKLYQSDDMAEHIKKVFHDSLIPTFVPLDKVGY